MKKNETCNRCKKAKIIAKGMCESCYRKENPRTKKVICKECGKQGETLIDGKCTSCYRSSY